MVNRFIITGSHFGTLDTTDKSTSSNDTQPLFNLSLTAGNLNREIKVTFPDHFFGKKRLLVKNTVIQIINLKLVNMSVVQDQNKREEKKRVVSFKKTCGRIYFS